MKQQTRHSPARDRQPRTAPRRPGLPLHAGMLVALGTLALAAPALAQDPATLNELKAENQRLRAHIEALEKERLALAPAASAVAAPDAAAAAAQARNDEQDSAAAVVVVARSRPEKLQDVPIPVSVISARALERNSASTIQDFAKLAPNLTVHAPNARQQNISIRGVGRTLFNDALEASVGVIVDGVVGGHIAQAWGDFGDLDHVEVLRGPQGTLMGKNSTLGAVNIVSRAPQFRREANIELTLGQDNAVGARAVVGGPIQDGVLAYRATVFSQKRAGPYTNTVVNESSEGVQEKNRIGARLQFLLRPAPDLSIRLAADREQSSELLLWAEPALFGDPASFPNGVSRTLARAGNGTAVNALTYTARLARPYFGGYQPNLYNWDSVERDAAEPTSSINNGLSAQVNWKLDRFDITSITAYRDALFDAKNDYDNTHFDIQTGGGYVKQKQLSQELRVNSSIGAALDYTAGLFYLDSEVDSPDRSLFGTDAGAFYATAAQYDALTKTPIGNQLLQDSLRFRSGATRSEPVTRSLGAFGQLNWHADDKTTLTLGLRQTREQRTNRFTRSAEDSLFARNGNAYYSARGATAAELAAAQGILTAQAGAKGPAFQSYEVAGAAINATSYSWLINPSYKVSDDVLLYASVGKGEKSGASLLDATGTNGLTAPVGYAIRPEKVKDFELGAKSALLAGRLVLNANLYQTGITDYQQTLSAVDTVATRNTGVTSFYNFVGNIPGVRLRGLELDSSINLGRNLLVNFGGAWNQALYSDFRNAPCPTEIAGQLDPVTGKVDPANQTCDYTGRQLPYASRLSGVLGADYRHALAGPFQLHLFGNVLYRSRANYAANLSSYGEQGGYSLLDAGIGIQAADGRWELALTGKNLRDQHYVTSVTPYSTNGAVTGASGERRSASVVFRAQL
jgi:iron complex outermembrane receptor protein